MGARGSNVGVSGSQPVLFLFPLVKLLPVCIYKALAYVIKRLGGVVRRTVPVPSHCISNVRD